MPRAAESVYVDLEAARRYYYAREAERQGTGKNLASFFGSG
jgi:hypothetical protein